MTGVQTCALPIWAFVELPRYFADTGRVQDLESRLVTCMVNLQGFNEAELINAAWGKGEMANLTALATWISAESKGMRFNLPYSHEKERSLTRWASVCSFSAVARMIFLVRLAMAKMTSASACKTCPT